MDAMPSRQNALFKSNTKSHIMPGHQIKPSLTSNNGGKDHTTQRSA